MTVPNATANDTVRRAFLAMSPEGVLEATDSLDLRHAKISAVVAMPLRALQQSRDVAHFAVSAPMPALRGLLELMSFDSLEAVIEALGDNAESPSFEQLRDAVVAIETNGSSRDDVIAMLAFAIGESFPAAGACQRLFVERDDLSLPELPSATSRGSLAASHEVDPEVKAQRLARREAQKRKKKASVAPVSYKKKAAATPARPASEKPAVTTSPEERRSARVTPVQAARFNLAHPLAGAVVLVEVPFDGIDPSAEEQTAKERPALVVAASSTALLVRPLYSREAPGRTLFSGWRRLLDKPSYLADETVVVEIAPDQVGARVGQLTTSEWNQTVSF